MLAQTQVLRSTVVKFASNNPSASSAAGLMKQPKSINQAKNKALESLVKTGKGVTVVGKSRTGKELTPNDQENRRAKGGGSFKVVSPRVNLLRDAPPPNIALFYRFELPWKVDLDAQSCKWRDVMITTLMTEFTSTSFLFWIPAPFARTCKPHC